MGGRRSDTRQRIQQVALELFAEQGYEQTSLRQIAERLQVTKAAVYFHFKAKEDILASVFDDMLDSLDELLAWGRTQPPTLQNRQEILRRYQALAGGRLPALMRLFQDNQTALRDLKIGERGLDRFNAICALLAGPQAQLDERLRAWLAVIALHSVSAPLPFLEATGSVQQQSAVALQVAFQLIADHPQQAQTPPSSVPSQPLVDRSNQRGGP